MAASRKTIAAVLMASAVVLCGCVARAKNTAASNAPAKPVATPPPAPVALSTPQTQVELPRPQPIDDAALPIETAAPTPPVETSPAPRANANATTVTPRRTPVRTESTATPSVAPPTEAARPPIQEVVAAGDLKRLQESAQTHRRETTRILAQVNERHLNQQQKSMLKSIRNFLSLSDQSEKRNDMRQADVLAEKAHLLARDHFQHGQ
jgi:hypothetical protein